MFAATHPKPTRYSPQLGCFWSIVDHKHPGWGADPAIRRSGDGAALAGADGNREDSRDHLELAQARSHEHRPLSGKRESRIGH